MSTADRAGRPDAATLADAQKVLSRLAAKDGYELLVAADTPFVDARGAVSNPTRLETYGSPFVGWVKVTVDVSRPDVFSFEPRLEAYVP